MSTIRTTDRHLLRAVRKGDFRALLALNDWWIEHGCERQSSLLHDLLRRAESHVVNPYYARLRMGRRESMRRWFRDFAKAINAIERCWRLPRHLNKPPRWLDPIALSARMAAYEWTCIMADRLLAHVRDQIAIRGDTVDDNHERTHTH